MTPAQRASPASGVRVGDAGHTRVTRWSARCDGTGCPAARPTAGTPAGTRWPPACRTPGRRAGRRRRSAPWPGRASPGSAAAATAPSGRRPGWPSGRWPRARELRRARSPRSLAASKRHSDADRQAAAPAGAGPERPHPVRVVLALGEPVRAGTDHVVRGQGRLERGRVAAGLGQDERLLDSGMGRIQVGEVVADPGVLGQHPGPERCRRAVEDRQGAFAQRPDHPVDPLVERRLGHQRGLARQVGTADAHRQVDRLHAGPQRAGEVRGQALGAGVRDHQPAPGDLVQHSLAELERPPVPAPAVLVGVQPHRLAAGPLRPRHRDGTVSVHRRLGPVVRQVEDHPVCVRHAGPRSPPPHDGAA